MASETLFLKSLSTSSPLRVGLLFPPGNLPPPTALVLEYLERCDFVEVVAAIRAAPLKSNSTPQPAVYRLYRWLDQLTAPAIARELIPQDCSAILEHFRSCSVDSDPTGDRLSPSESQSSALSAQHFDLILQLGSPPDASALAPFARYGVWIMRLGDPLLGDDQPRHFWSTINQSVPLSISLQARIPTSSSLVTLATGTLSLSSSISTARNLMGPAHMGAGLVLSTLWQLHGSGWEFVLSRHHDPAVVEPQRDFPTIGQMLTSLLLKAALQVRHRIRQHNTGAIWRVGIRCGSQLEGIEAARQTAGLNWLQAPPGRYYADPFVMLRDGEAFLFVEEFDLAADKGRIACMRLNPDGSSEPPRVALECPYHVSYPQILVHDGQLFMIPESGYHETVEIYRAVDFPDRWELNRVLFNGAAFDTTVLHHGGLFWFFVSLLDTAYPQYALLVLFYSDSLLGEWKLHPASPISTDIRAARCAGPLFVDQGQWIRPAQDSSESYGGALHYRRILRIDTRLYCEEPAGSIDTQAIPGAIGVHTYSRAQPFEVLDAKSRIRLSSQSVRAPPRQSQ
jgi:hypothetical protein